MNKVIKSMVVGLGLLASTAQAYPLQSLKQVGATEMNWLFWKLYDIRLLTADGRYQQNDYPLALAIRYARDIPREQLIKSTVDEWQRQEIDYAPEWAQRLEEIWPSVAEGDEIAVHVDADGHSHFYFNQQSVGSIDDQAFAAAFLAIWLSDNTLKPVLTRKLTGVSDA